MSEKILPKDLQNSYDSVDTEYKSIVDSILFASENDEFNPSVRPRPRYSNGSVDDMMFPIQPKAAEIAKKILNGSGYIYVVEGGARGGKDVFMILIWTIYLMTTPHKTHLVLGKSLEHALLNVLHSSGYGLFYTIPNGVFVRNSDSGAQRGIYKFTDMYGVEKEVLFYGNDKKNDNEKYQGFTIGSTYVNEGMTQHLDGINQAIQRMASSHNHLMIITQNPKGQAHPFYTDFEKSKTMLDEELELMEYIRDRHKYDYEDKKREILSTAEKDKKDFVSKYCKIKNVPSPKYLSQDDALQLRIGLRDIDFHYDKSVSGLTVQDFYTNLNKDHVLYDRSMKKVVDFDRGGKNPNNVLNAYNYSYYHFTVDDNLGLTEMQRNEYKKEFKKGSALYLQKTLGIRKTAEKAVYKEFSSKNVIDIELDTFNNSSQTIRVIGIDPGFNHETGILDAEIDYRTGTVFIIQERLLDYKNQDATIEDIENVFWEVVRSRKNRQYDMLIVDPSHAATINHFINRGIHVTPANNSSLMTRKKNKKYGNENQQKSLLGIELLKYGFDIKKIMVNSLCVNLINQIESNEFEYNEVTGNLKIRKINDDVLDVLRYIVNTVLGGTQYWQNDTKGGEIDGENALLEILGDEGTQDKEWNLDRIFEQAQQELNKSTGGNAIFGYGSEFDNESTKFLSDDDRQDGLWFLGKHWS
jgi:hypothetical protein